MIEIAGRKISIDHPPFIIAEMSANHNQSLERALKIVEAAAKAGAHGLKLQTYTPDTMTLDLDKEDFYITNKNCPWDGRKLYDLYKDAYLPWDWHKPIFDRARQLGLIVFSAPFDETAVDFLETLNVPCYKIASFEITDISLIKKVASMGRPVIMSTGMASFDEISEAVDVCARAGVGVVLLKCTSAYPAGPEGCNLRTIRSMRITWGCEVGLSDHTEGIGVPIAAVASGASVIEKHFTLTRGGGPDSSFSIEPVEMHELVRETERAWQALGRVQYGPTSGEYGALSFRRSIYVCEDLKAGQALYKRNLRCIRPGHGLSPKYYEEVLGRTVNQAVKKGTPFSWDLI